MKDKGRVKKTMSDWDKQVCAHLDDLWRQRQAGELEVIDAKALLENAKVKVERVIKEQQQAKKVRFNVQTPGYAV